MNIPTSINNVCNDPITLLRRYKDHGIDVLGYSCSYVPEELIISAKIQPFRIPNFGSTVSTMTPTFICQFASTILENILKLEEFFSGFVLAHTCDPMWRLYDIIKKKIRKPVFFLRVPHNTDGKFSMEFFEKELLRFRDFLTENFGSEVNDEALSDAIEVCNENRSLLREVYMQNDNGKCCVNGLDRFKLVLASMWMPKKEVNSQIRVLDFKNNSIKECKVRLHINGTAIYDLNFIKMIEGSGCFIASDDLCTGSRYFWENVEKSEEPTSALAHRYLHRTPCPSHGPLHKRLEYVCFMVEKFKVHGILTITERFCDPMLYDAVHVKDMFTRRNLPTMLIDYENFEQEASRIKTRVEAFIESLSG